jgi:lipoyl-dependent peroxiredoxin
VAVTRTAHTTWTGGLTDGSGTVFFDSSGIGAYDVTWPARSEQPGGKTSPEELIAAALSSCYSMALSHALTQRGTPPKNIDTQARVTLEPGAGITSIHLSVRAALSESGDPEQQWRTPNIADPNQGDGSGTDETVDVDAEFQKLAAQVKDACPVGQALSGVKITIDAALED